MSETKLNRRDFVKTAVTAGVAASALGRPKRAAAGVYSPNEAITIGVIGMGGRGMGLLRWAMDTGEKPLTPARVVAVSDVYAKRLRLAREGAKCDGYLDYREIIQRKDIDAVIIATPDHWHERMTVEAMENGKDVYLEKPMTLTIEEARNIHHVSQKTGRLVQVGSQGVSADQWFKARKAIREGMIGKVIMSQGSFHRNSTGGEWNWPIDENAGPDGKDDDYIDWKMWLGNAPPRPYDADRFFRFRKYWDYSGGIATDLFYHMLAPLNIAWGDTQFPHRVIGTGGIYMFKDEREVPDTFTLTADFPAGHTVVFTSSMANDTFTPGLIRGHEGTIHVVPGNFQATVDHITVTPQRIYRDKFTEKYGTIEMKLACDPRPNHMENFLTCVKTREAPVLDALAGYKTMVTIAMSVQSYRESRVLYFDEKNEKVVSDPPLS